MKYTPNEPVAKTCMYHGNMICVPFWAKYIATDKDGHVYTYQMKPWSSSRGYWCSSDYDTKEQWIGTAVFDGDECWEESLVEIE